MELDKAKIEEALARGLALLMEKETAHAFRTKQWGGRAWKPSNISANLLINSSMLRNSIHHTAVGNQVEVSSPLPHANIHNQGGRIPITDRMRGYFWARYKEAKDPIYSPVPSPRSPISTSPNVNSRESLSTPTKPLTKRSSRRSPNLTYWAKSKLV